MKRSFDYEGVGVFVSQLDKSGIYVVTFSQSTLVSMNASIRVTLHYYIWVEPTTTSAPSTELATSTTTSAPSIELDTSTTISVPSTETEIIPFFLAMIILTIWYRKKSKYP